ncbi:hypothetical protein JQC91_08070 [Jannaschia sp. Os4]|uniref:hypothetical protein n=1 Tax=Jannaschia sp. Os4 TaxID=2807617 RepID=UPI00193A9205|nr:hypothetical protein [Jannaschia sp. Os4]MBM2576260.1 hypothetical protein [Jannaschia sp. Os4]
MSPRRPVLDPARLLRGRADALARGPHWEPRALICLLRPSDGWTEVLPPGGTPRGAAETVLVLADPARLDARCQPTPLDPAGRLIGAAGAAELVAMADCLAPAPYVARMAGLAWWLHRFEALRRAAIPRGDGPGPRRRGP